MIPTQTDSGHKLEINNNTLMKTLKIMPPEGYEIDREKSTFEEIVFKPIKKQLPKSWEELEEIDGYWVNGLSYPSYISLRKPHYKDKNTFFTEEQAKASISLAQLSQLREVYRDGWVPDWSNWPMKYCIVKYQGHFLCENYYKTAHFLAFQSPEIRDEFLANFKDLIEEASPLLFG